MYSTCQYFISLDSPVTFHGMEIAHRAIPQITDTWTDCFYIVAFMNNAAVNTHKFLHWCMISFLLGATAGS